MPTSEIDTDRVVATLNGILELELAGVVRYTHYSLMIFGHARIPVTGWMREQALEGHAHAVQAGEHVTSLGGHPSLKIGKLLETERHGMDDILRESIEHERRGLALYRQLLEQVAGRHVTLEDYARSMIVEEEAHVSEMEKMLRQPGSLEPAS